MSEVRINRGAIYVFGEEWDCTLVLDHRKQS